MPARTASLRPPAAGAKRTPRPRTPARRLPDRARPDAAVRERILRAALRTFADQGYDGASTSAIAKAVGVTQPLVHYYFRSKDELWRAAVDALFAAARIDLLGGTVELRDLDGPATLRLVLRRFARFSLAHPELARLMAREGALPGSRLKWMVKRHLRPFFTALEGLLQAGVRAGWAKALPTEHVIFFLVGASAHLSLASALARELWGIDPGAAAIVAGHSDALVELALHGLATTRPEEPS